MARTTFFPLLAAAASFAPALAAALPPIGEWDGVTPSAKLETPYEDPAQFNVPFGIISYYSHPWRGYMDTWPASKLLEVPATQWNINDKYAEPLCLLLEQWGICALRIEIGWGNITWDDQLSDGCRNHLKALLPALQKHNIRPLILLNAHHGVPCPLRDVTVQVTAEAKKGDRSLAVESVKGVRPGYTGLQHPDYIAAFPLVIEVGRARLYLSDGLPADVKPGPLTLKELKYQPMQGTVLKDGTEVPAAKETFDGWAKYAAAVGRAVREVLGTEGKPDAGFDIEVWNEQTFGSNFLNINNYYADKLEFSEEFVYTRERPLEPSFAPDARTKFEQKGCYAILPMTIDYFNDPANGFPGVRVISGFANQWPWDSGTSLWDRQAGFSRHYYTGGWRDCSPDDPLSPKTNGTINALGEFEGKKDGNDWHTIYPGTNFIPTFRCGFPEFFHTGFKTESLSRDVMPNSALCRFKDHGRYTHNGDFRIAQVWQTEVNYDRWPFIEKLIKDTGAQKDDARLLDVAKRLAGKTLLRQYLFHAHKGLRRIFIFCLEPSPHSLGILPPSLYDALDKSGLQVTDDVRAAVPPEFKGMAWLTALMKTGEPILAPRPLEVRDLVEYKPRLVFAGDGTPAHPHRWNRDQFVFLPFQLNPGTFVIPYYVMTLDMTHEWDKAKEALDPARYDMPGQEFDVTIGNVAGKKAEVSAYDLLSNAEVPVTVVASTSNTLTVRLSAVDYPRVLKIIEPRPGPQITEAKVTPGSMSFTVAWKTNVPCTVSLSYGREWCKRSAIKPRLKEGRNSHTVIIPTDGVWAVRITAVADGLTDVWPRWDEDPAGQVIVQPRKEGEPPITDTIDLQPAAPVELPVVEQNPRLGYAVCFPKGTALAGAADDRACTLGTGANAVTVRVRYLPNSASRINIILPVTTVRDKVQLAKAALQDNREATHAAVTLSPVDHEDTKNLAQRFLMVPAGADRKDLLVISADGTPAGVRKQDDTLKAIFMSVKMTK